MAENKEKKLVSADEAVKAVKKTAAKAGDAAENTAAKAKKTAAAAKDAAEGTAKKALKKAADAVEETVEPAVDEVEEAVEEIEEEVEEAKPAKKTAPKKPAAKEEGSNLQQAKPKGSSTGYRIGAIALWVVALGLEIVAIMILLGKIKMNFLGLSSLAQIIVFLVLDLICVVIGSQLWKKANHISPMSKKNKTLFWIWNNMGVIVAVACFLPFIIIALSNKNTDKKTRVVATVVAIIALLIAGLASYDWNPVSKEELEAATNTITGDVYWAPFGKVYHTHQDCQALNHTDTLTYGSVDQAIAANRTRLCSFCAKRDDITNLATDGKDVSAEDILPDEIGEIDLEEAAD
ncbi:MAG: hypothetical protein J5865_07885 [Lachnospiraceae bacterium]|nr:hypothetical protein [Lachnospiraceae bacterium]